MKQGKRHRRHVSLFKPLTALTMLLLTLPALTGCNGILSNYKEVEQLLVIQTMGLDTKNGGVVLSLGSTVGGESEDKPRRLSGTGDSITSALHQIYNYSYEEELFSYYVNHVLIGEKAAEEGIDDYLSYICRSPIMRVDVPLFIVRGGTAEDAIMTIGDGNIGISEVMSNIRSKQALRGESRIFTTADVIRNLKRHGSALICALECAPAAESNSEGDNQPKSTADSSGAQESSQSGSGGEENSSTGQSSATGQGDTGGEKQDENSNNTAAAAGYAVIRDGKLCKYIEAEDAAAVSYIINDVGVYDIEVNDRFGQLVVLEINGGGSELTPVWSSPGVLEELDIKVHVSASVLEIRGKGDLNNAEYTDHLTAQLEAQVSQRISNVLQCSRSLRADFLGLASKVEQASPNNYRLITEKFPDLLPALKFTVTVSGELNHSNDMKDA